MTQSKSGPVRQSIQSIANQVINQQSLQNEIRVTGIKSIIFVISCCLDLIIFVFPQPMIGEESVPITIFIISFTASIVSIGFLKALKHPMACQWLPTLQLAIALSDGFILGLFITNIAIVLGESNPQIITNIAALCSLLAVTGGIRIHRRASVITTILAGLNFIYGAILFDLTNAVSGFALFTIVGTGLLGMLISNIVRRQGKNEAGRMLMEQFLPSNVVEAAFESPNRLLAEPRNFDVTVMVTDLRGFTSYSEKLAPHEVFDFLNDFQGLLSTIVESHGGWVDKFMGDGMLAVFGAPKILDNHGEMALYAAQEILKESAKLSSLPVGIGLHSGAIVAGCLGSTGHLEFTVIGDTVNVTSRLEALTKKMECNLLISASTKEHLEDMPLRNLGKVPIRGRDEEIEIFTTIN